MSPLQEAKFFLVEHLGLAKDALHIYVGLIVFLAVAGLFRVPLRDWRPLGAVLLATLAGEIWDMIDTLNDGRAIRFAGNWQDVWNTMFWPTALFLCARYTQLLRR